jgi:hypothetical protein
MTSAEMVGFGFIVVTTCIIGVLYGRWVIKTYRYQKELAEFRRELDSLKGSPVDALWREEHND